MDTETVTIRCTPCKGNEEGLKRINAEHYDPTMHILAGEESPREKAVTDGEAAKANPSGAVKAPKKKNGKSTEAQ